jgi:hypothetical protein
MEKYVCCNNCPASASENHKFYCAINGSPLIERENFMIYQTEDDCPLKRLELKDGFVYTPEVEE